ncbi:MAG TPA: ATP synthase F0 subunit B [Kofleriaceae bacterium]
MKRLILLALLALAGIAHADHPENERRNAEAAKVEPEIEDPTSQFNFLNFSYRGKDEYGGQFGDGKMVDPKTGETVPGEEEPMSAPFVLALLNFGILLLILAKYLAPAGHKVAAERHDQIKTALDEAAKLRDEAKRKLTEYEGRISGVDAEIGKLVEGIRADAEADKKRILENAERQAAQMKRDAEQRIAAEIETARAQLTAEVAAAAAAAAASLVRDKSTPDDQKRLVTSFVSGIAGLGGR